MSLISPPWFDVQRLLCLVNDFRKQEGLAPLELDRQLCEAAQELSDHQARTNTMSHVGANGLQVGKRLTAFGYKWQAVAENVGYGYTSLEEAMSNWLKSPPHRKNLLGVNFTKFGAAAAMSPSSGLVFLTQDFTKPMVQITQSSITFDLDNMLSLLNKHRATCGSPPLKLDRRLVATSQSLVSHMAKIGQLTWQGPNGETQADRAQREGFQFSMLGENMAVGFKSETEAVEFWMNNPANSKPLMDANVTRIGAAYELGKDGKVYWVQDYGRLLNEAAEEAPAAPQLVIPKLTPNQASRPTPMQATEAEKRIMLPTTGGQTNRPKPMQQIEEQRLVLPTTGSQANRPKPMQMEVDIPPSPPASPVLHEEVTITEHYMEEVTTATAVQNPPSPPLSPVEPMETSETPQANKRKPSSGVPESQIVVEMVSPGQIMTTSPSNLAQAPKKLKAFSLFKKIFGKKK